MFYTAVWILQVTRGASNLVWVPFWCQRTKPGSVHRITEVRDARDIRHRTPRANQLQAGSGSGMSGPCLADAVSDARLLHHPVGHDQRRNARGDRRRKIGDYTSA